MSLNDSEIDKVVAFLPTHIRQTLTDHCANHQVRIQDYNYKRSD